MKEDDLTKKIESIVKKKMGNESSGHDYLHIKRVIGIAKEIMNTHGGNPSIVIPAILLHDISMSDRRYNDHPVKSRVIAQEILSKLSHPYDKQIVQIIQHHESLSLEKIIDTDIPVHELKILQDADRIDAIGAIGIGRTFTFGGYFGVPMYDELDPMIIENYDPSIVSRSTLTHFYDKLFKIYDWLHFKKSREIASQRIDFMKKFTVQFIKEIKEDYSEEN